MIGHQPLVMIEWVNSFGCRTEWTPIADIAEPPPMMCRSVGWLLVDGKENKVVCPHMHDACDAIGAVPGGCGEMTIPTRCVVRVTLLNRGGMTIDD